MKSVCNLFMMAVFALSLGLSGCVKEDPAKPLEVDWSRTATIKGTLLVEGDIFSAVPKWSAPVPYRGLTDFREVFIVSIDYNYLVSRSEGRYYLPKEKISYSLITGEFTIEVPVGVAPTQVLIRLSDFYGIQKKLIPGSTPAKDVDVDVIWRASSRGWSSKWVVAGQTSYFETWKLDAGLAEEFTQEGDDV